MIPPSPVGRSYENEDLFVQSIKHHNLLWTQNSAAIRF